MNIQCNLCPHRGRSLHVVPRVSSYAIHFFPHAHKTAFTALPRLSPPMGLGAGYNVTAGQALHLTRYVWHILPQQLTLLASVTISRDRLNLHHPLSTSFCSSCRRSVRFGASPLGKTSIAHVFSALHDLKRRCRKALFRGSLETKFFSADF